MSVAIVKYNAGNVRSVMTALERLDVSYAVTDDRRELLSVYRVIFPGVGEESSAERYLAERGLDDTIRALTAPVLGICLGLQLLCEWSEEGPTNCLGIMPGTVKRFTKPRKIPHMGWSRVEALSHPIFRDIAEGSYFYFVHSFRLDVTTETIATCRYEESFAAAVARGNFVGVQFHPEKSADVGERMLRNFLEWKV